MGLKTALASAVIPGLGQIINGQTERAIVIWTGLLLSVFLFPLPVFGTITFAGIYIAGIIDAYDSDHDIDSIHLKNWKDHSWGKLLDKIRKHRENQ